MTTRFGCLKILLRCLLYYPIHCDYLFLLRWERSASSGDFNTIITIVVLLPYYRETEKQLVWEEGPRVICSCQHVKYLWIKICKKVNDTNTQEYIGIIDRRLKAFLGHFFLQCEILPKWFNLQTYFSLNIFAIRLTSHTNTSVRIRLLFTKARGEPVSFWVWA